MNAHRSIDETRRRWNYAAGAFEMRESIGWGISADSPATTRCLAHAACITSTSRTRTPSLVRIAARVLGTGDHGRGGGGNIDLRIREMGLHRWSKRSSRTTHTRSKGLLLNSASRMRATCASARCPMGPSRISMTLACSRMNGMWSTQRLDKPRFGCVKALARHSSFDGGRYVRRRCVRMLCRFKATNLRRYRVW